MMYFSSVYDYDKLSMIIINLKEPNKEGKKGDTYIQFSAPFIEQILVIIIIRIFMPIA